jgi:RIO kinase 1
MLGRKDPLAHGGRAPPHTRRFTIARKIDPDAHPDSIERPKRRTRRAPKGRQNVTRLVGDDGEAASGSALRRLQERGFVHDIVGELKSGKEATVYLGRSPLGDVAVKIFRDIEVRSFKSDQRYLEGRWVGDARLAKAIRRRSGRGLRALKAMWAAHEYLMLWRLWNAGIPVPEPLVGPEAFDIADAGEVVVMRFVGEPDAPAPRLSDAVLSPEEAQDAYGQCVDVMTACWRLGVVHGDFSTYNLLWWQGRVVLIDFPQAMDRSQAGAREVLAQDAASLTLSFRKLGVEADADELLRRVTAEA